jgi:CheY-like chemotaxis protein
VLVAEDNPVNCKLALLQLKKFGFEAEIANNGYEAVQAVQGGTFDLVLMDCQMPELDGLAATRRIRAWERESHAPRRVPIIALTRGTVLGIRDECLQAGMDKYVSKPVRWAELRTAVHQLIPRLSTPPSLEETSPSPASDSAHLQPMELRS